MAQFDVYRLRSGGGLVVDCQSGLLDHLNTRFAVPLIPRDEAPEPARRLNPIFQVEGRDCVMVTQFAGAVHRRELGARVVSLQDSSFEVMGALDVLLTGV